MMEAATTSEMSVNFYQTTRCYNPEVIRNVNFCCEHLLSSMKNVKSTNRMHLTDEHLEGAYESQQQKLNMILKD
jgi:hypothetical protein